MQLPVLINALHLSMEEAVAVCGDVSVLRRIQLEVKQLPIDSPSYWEVVTSFGFKNAARKPSSEKVRVVVENLQFLDSEALIYDESS